MTITIHKGNTVNPIDDDLRDFLSAEEALTRCTEMLRGEGISGFDIAEALIQRVYAVLKPERTDDAVVLQTFIERSIDLMDDTIRGFQGIRDIYAEELD